VEFLPKYGEAAADIFGRLNEVWISDLYSNSKDPRSLNMDLWNNAVGRKYGKKSQSRESLIKKDKNGRNELFFDVISKQIFTLAEFLDQIAAGAYPGYVVKMVRGKPTPVSKPDKRRTNNIG
jgi:hypothetical protein